jgi:hypothetical protein
VNPADDMTAFLGFKTNGNEVHTIQKISICDMCDSKVSRYDTWVGEGQLTCQMGGGACRDVSSAWESVYLHVTWVRDCVLTCNTHSGACHMGGGMCNDMLHRWVTVYWCGICLATCIHMSYCWDSVQSHVICIGNCPFMSYIHGGVCMHVLYA